MGTFYTCAGCGCKMSLVIGWNLISVKKVLTSVDRENVNCRLYLAPGERRA